LHIAKWLQEEEEKEKICLRKPCCAKYNWDKISWAVCSWRRQ